MFFFFFPRGFLVAKGEGFLHFRMMAEKKNLSNSPFFSFLILDDPCFLWVPRKFENYDPNQGLNYSLLLIDNLVLLVTILVQYYM